MGFFDKETNTNQSQWQNSNSTQNPWSAQIPYLMQAFGGASDALGRSQSQGGPNDFVAGLTPEQQQLYHQMYSYGSSNGVPGQTAATGDALNGMGMGALSQGLSGLAGFNPGTSGFNPSATSGYAPTAFSDILKNANAAANDPSVQGQVDAATRDATRAAMGDVRQNNQGAAGSGNINSSRAGLTEGLIRSRLGDTVADTSANIRGAAYGRGLSSALSSAMAGDQTRLGAGTSADQMRLSALQGGDQTRLGALSQLTGAGGNAVGQGLDAWGNSLGQSAGLFNLAGQGGAGLQQGNQLGLDNQMARYQFGQNQLWNPLQNFFNIIGNNSWGGSTNSSSIGGGTKSTTESPSMASNIGTMVGMAGSFF
jgi:hypothetical protein